MTTTGRSGRRIARRVVALGAVCGLLAGAGGCGGDAQPAGRTTAGDLPQAIARHDLAVDRALSAMHKAALRGERRAVGVAQRRLEQLARADPTPAARSTERDPFRRVIDEIAFKRAPLFVQQITTTDGSHRVYAGVDRGAFCLLAPDARRAAVADVYAPVEQRMRAHDIRDWQLVVAALTPSVPRMKDGLAIGRGGRVRLLGGRC